MSISNAERWRAALATVASRTDGFLTHLNRVLASSGGVEAVLCTLCYTLIFVHTRLRRLLERQYERLALALTTKASSALVPGETVVASIEPPKTRLSETTASVKLLADLIDDFRFFTRLWGSLTVYGGARDNYFSPPGDAILKSLTWAQVTVYGIFQVLENGAYLVSKGVLRGEAWAERQPRWWVWSNRFWLGHVVLEALKLLRVRQLQYNEDFGAKDMSEKDSSPKIGEDSRLTVQSEELKRKWHRDFYANAGWFPLTLHWSFYDEANSPFNDTWVGLCGMLPGVMAFREEWERTTE